MWFVFSIHQYVVNGVNFLNNDEHGSFIQKQYKASFKKAIQKTSGEMEKKVFINLLPKLMICDINNGLLFYSRSI